MLPPPLVGLPLCFGQRDPSLPPLGALKLDQVQTFLAVIDQSGVSRVASGLSRMSAVTYGIQNLRKLTCCCSAARPIG